METKEKIFCHPGNCPRLLALPCQLEEIGYLPSQINWNRNRTLHALYFCIILNREGKGKGLVNGIVPKIKYALPCLHIHKAGTVLHTVRASKHDEIFFSYTGKNAEFMQNIGIEEGHFEITAEFSEIVLRIKKELLLPDNPMKADNLDLLALELLTVIKGAQKMQQNKHREDGTRFQELLSFLELHLQEELPLSFLLTRFGFSRRTFFRIWKKNFSCSFTEYRNNLKLSHGANLLISTDLSIGDIAQKCSYSSPTYFIRRFKRHYLLTPENYRLQKKNVKKLQ